MSGCTTRPLESPLLFSASSSSSSSSSLSPLKAFDWFSWLQQDCQMALRSIWKETGEDQLKKITEFSDMVSDAVDVIYRKVLKDSHCQKLDLEEMVATTETQLKELLGLGYSQVVASKELPLRAQLSINASRLRDLESVCVDGYSLVGRFVGLLVKLRQQILVLRAMLDLPGCNSVDLEEVLVSSIEGLGSFSPGKVAADQPIVSLPVVEQQRPIFQRLHQFYEVLCTLENACNSTKDVDITSEVSGMNTGLQHPQEFKESNNSVVARKRSFQTLSVEDIDESPPSKTSFGYSAKRSNINGRTGVNTYGDEAIMLEQLSHKVLTKVEEINREVERSSGSFMFRFMSRDSPAYPTKVIQTSEEVYSVETPTSVLSIVGMEPPNASVNSTHAQGKTVNAHGDYTDNVTRSEAGNHSFQSSTAKVNNRSELYSSDSKHGLSSQIEMQSKTMHQGERKPGVPNQTGNAKVLNSIKHEISNTAEMQSIKSSSSSSSSFLSTGGVRWPLLPITNNNMAVANTIAPSRMVATTTNPSPQQLTCLQTAQPSSGMVTTSPLSVLNPTPSIQRTSTPPPPPPPPPLPPLPQGLTKPPASPKTPGVLQVPLPPPPPPPPSIRRPQSCSKLAKLKRSTTISKLYIGMKKKVEGAVRVQSSLSSSFNDVNATRRSSLVPSGTREGMAEALAEITRRSSYFRKIEDDVQKHADSIMEVKSRLETFVTDDMMQLLEFHKSVESRLELLTDESQVLARFNGFPVRKLETLRAAASLYSRMNSLLEQMKGFTIEHPIPEQIEKATSLFEKVKMEVEGIERTKDEDVQRFRNQQIFFRFDIINSIKEAVVGLSSRCLAAGIKESQCHRSKASSEDEYNCAKDLTKMRTNFQMLYKAFQLAFRIHNFAGGHDEKAEKLSMDLALEMETYPSTLWSELVTN